MTFIYGFFLVNFIPFGILIVAGIILFFSRKFKNEKWHYPLLFIVMVLLVISLWRMPVVFDRRYALPTVVPGIVISVYLIMFLPDILKRFRIKFAVVIVRIAVVILLIVCVAKTLRFQDRKPYLYGLNKTLEDYKRFGGGDAVLLIFGNPRGSLELPDNVTRIMIPQKHSNDRFFDVKYQFDVLDEFFCPEILSVCYPHLYLLCIEKKAGNFILAWKNKYKNTPELIYEHVKPKDQVSYQLYHILSPYKVSCYSKRKLEEFKINNNLLKFGDCARKIKIFANNPVIEILKKRGINLLDNAELYLPVGWYINPAHGWAADSAPVSISFVQGVDNSLKISSQGLISLILDEKISGNKKCFVSIDANFEKNGLLILCAYGYSKTGKEIKKIVLKKAPFDKNNCNFLVEAHMPNISYIKLALLISGDVIIHGVKVIPYEMLN